MEPEAAPVAGRGIEPQFAAETFDAFADEREADASAGIDLEGMEALEQAEYLFMVVGMDADAVVFDGDADEGVGWMTR